MAEKKIDIKLGTVFDKSGISEANTELAKLAQTVKTANDDIKKATLRSAGETISYSDQADKAVRAMGGSYKTLEEQLYDLSKTTKTVGDTTTQTSDTAKQSITSVNTVMSALHGNIDSIGKLIGGLGGKFSSIGKLGASTFSAIGAAIYGVFEFLKSVKGLITTVFNLDKVSEEASKASAAMLDLANSQEILASKMDDARKKSQDQAKSRQQEINSAKDLTKAELELAKAKDLANAKSQDEKEDIQRKYGSQTAEVEEEAQRRTRDNRRKELEEERSRLQKEKKTAEGLLAEYKKQFENGGSTGTDEALEQRDIIARKKAELEKNKEALNALDDEEEVAEKLIEARKLKEETSEKEVQQKREEEAKKVEDQLRKENEQRIEKEKQDQLREIEEIKKAKLQAEKELHKVKVDNLKSELDESKKASSEKSSIASSAQSEFDRAFALYRDPEAAKRQIEEERDYAADYKQLQKDASRYGGKWRIDTLANLMAAGDTKGQQAQLEEWRKSKSFTPEVEAMVRASAADQTKTTAEDELRKINHNTEQLANKLDELLKIK